MNSYQKLNAKWNITRLYNGELERLIMRFGTKEQNKQLDEMRNKYIKMIEELKIS